MHAAKLICAAVLGVAGLLAGCGGERTPIDPRADAVDRKVREKWGKTLAELPTLELRVISPHNENITDEFEWAFSLHHAVAHGQKVDVRWRDVGGGSTAVLRFLENVYAASEASGIDIVWGGGDYNFQKMAEHGILQPMKLPDDVAANIPGQLGGLELYDPKGYWCGSAVSGFGFLYNRGNLRRAGLQPPRQWDDLGGAGFFDQVCLADPTQSGSAAAAYEMIVQSAASWPEGWAKLLAILGNANRFMDSAGHAANAPVLGEAVVATCIDFYGGTRVAEAPDILVYVSPKGQTAFNPDPIAILKNPPHPQLAQRFVDFVLSRRGQALWGLEPGEADGPIRSALGRQPIRRDVYALYAGRLSPWIVNPYEAGKEMKVDRRMWAVRFGMLRQLVRAAAIDNRQFLRAARKRLIKTGFEPKRLAEFNRLPENVDRAEKIPGIAEQLRNKTARERIVTDWQRFFRDKYQRVAR